jgi:hypothetical protein
LGGGGRGGGGVFFHEVSSHFLNQPKILDIILYPT